MINGFPALSCLELLDTKSFFVLPLFFVVLSKQNPFQHSFVKRSSFKGRQVFDGITYAGVAISVFEEEIALAVLGLLRRTKLVDLVRIILTEGCIVDGAAVLLVGLLGTKAGGNIAPVVEVHPGIGVGLDSLLVLD